MTLTEVWQRSLFEFLDPVAEGSPPPRPPRAALPGAFVDALCAWCGGRGLRCCLAPGPGERPWGVCLQCGRVVEV